MCVCHTCDVPACINPAHLWAGTNADNVLDKERKGRGNQPKGIAQAHAKLTEKDVIEIRERYSAGGITLKELAKEKSMHLSGIWFVISRRNWKHI
jgi:hypothetical protein